MSFRFSGIFATAGAEVLDELRGEFGGIGRQFSAPFAGVGVSHVAQAVPIPADDDSESAAFAEQLIAFSRRFPQVTFVYLYAECFGGVCEYAGFVFRDGQRVHDEPFRDDVGDLGPLKRLVRFLNVELGDGAYFEPLSRDLFFRASHIPSEAPAALSERVREITAKLAHAWEPSPVTRRKQSLSDRLCGGGPEAG